MLKRLLILLLGLAPGLADAGNAEAPLFATDDVMEMALAVDFGELCRPRESEECEFTPTTLSYRDDSGALRNLPVEVKTRGGWRSLSRNCSAPLLWVQFPPEETAGTPFVGQSLLPLTTHCGKGASLELSGAKVRRADFEQYLLREYLGHRIYNQLSEFSLRTRLVRIAYPDGGSFGKPVPHYAFFTEHFDALAARTGSRRHPRGGFDADLLDAQAAATLALFQYLIGNTDWSIARERNTLLLTQDRRQVPVPYDLDMSGLVNAHYAGPAPGLPIDSVRERFFLGYCQPGTDWEALFGQFAGAREAILDLSDSVPGLSRKSRRNARRFLDTFFEQIAQPTERASHIVDACQPWPPSGVDHTSPLED